MHLETDETESVWAGKLFWFVLVQIKRLKANTTGGQIQDSALPLMTP